MTALLKYLLTVFTVAAAFLASVTAYPAERVLRLGVFVPPQTINVRKVLAPWVAEINAAAAGEVRVELFAGGAMGRSGRAQYQLLKARVHDIGWIVLSYTPGQFADTRMFEVPLYSDDPMAISLAFWRLYQAGRLDGFDEVVPLALYVSTPFYLHLNFPARTIADLAGRKIRVVTYSQARVVEAVGATPIGGITATQMAESLSRGLIDGTAFNWYAARAMGLTQVTRHHFEQPFAYSPALVAMNKKTFASLSPRMRAIFRDLSGERLIRLFVTEMVKAGQAVATETRERKGHRFIDATPADTVTWRSAFSALEEQYARDVENGRDKLAAYKAMLADLES